MKERLLHYLVCPVSREKLRLKIQERDGEEIIRGSLVSAGGQEYSINNGVPRFVSSENIPACWDLSGIDTPASNLTTRTDFEGIRFLRV